MYDSDFEKLVWSDSETRKPERGVVKIDFISPNGQEFLAGEDVYFERYGYDDYWVKFHKFNDGVFDVKNKVDSGYFFERVKFPAPCNCNQKIEDSFKKISGCEIAKIQIWGGGGVKITIGYLGDFIPCDPPKSRYKEHFIEATHCPFCGQKYD